MTQQNLDAHQWLSHAHAELDRKSDLINRMNVFPVPDADTGTNMAATLSTIEADGSIVEYVSSCLLNARGNSGTILAAWLAGFLADFSESTQKLDLAAAFESGAKKARAVLLEPAEGTMLTVMDAVAESPEDSLHAAVVAVEQTAQVLHANQTAGTVDAGALGFLLVLNELARALGNATLSEEKLAQFFTEPATPAVESHIQDGEIEVMFGLRLTPDKVATLRDVLPDLGNSISVTDIQESKDQDGEAHVAVHIHTQHEKKVLKFAERLGTLAYVRTTQLHA